MSMRMTPWSRRATALVALIASLALPAGAAAAPSPPTSLHVLDGEGWQADDDFSVGWAIPGPGSSIAAVHYRVRNPEGLVELGPVRMAWPAEHVVASVRGAGAHTFEVWLEDTAGAQGPPSDTKLRFDPHRPGEVAPLQSSGWLGRNEFPYPVRLTHPQGPAPLSGIRGYAISIDRAATAGPCQDAYLCTDAETDLRGGIGADALLVDELPEGTSYVHAVAVSGAQVRSLSPGHALLRVDRTYPRTRLAGLPEGWTNRAVELEATATDALSGMSSSGGGAPFTAIRIDDGPPVSAPGASVQTTVVAPGIHTISYYARDAAGNVDDGADANGTPNDSPATVPLRIDREPPAVVFAGSADPGDPELIEARVSDRLSGPDRGLIAVRAAGSTDAYEPLPTFAAGEALLGRWRSEDHPAGEYEFRVTAYDAAGNASTSTVRANGEPMVLPNPLKSRAALTAGFGEGRRWLPQSQLVRPGSRRDLQRGFDDRLGRDARRPAGQRRRAIRSRRGAVAANDERRHRRQRTFQPPPGPGAEPRGLRRLRRDEHDDGDGEQSAAPRRPRPRIPASLHADRCGRRPAGRVPRGPRRLPR
jgi:hypothetical protein